ncbi:MAG: hypothetical protein ABI947_25230 [Chloroflexota bacterium]
MNVASYRKILKISVLLLTMPICAFGLWSALLMFGIVYSETSAHNMEPLIPFNAQLVTVNEWSGSDGASEQKIYYCAADLNQVLTTMEKQRGSFTKSTNRQGHEIYSNMIEDRSLPMQILSQAGTKDDIPDSFPSVEIRLQSGRGTDSTGTTITVNIGWPSP